MVLLGGLRWLKPETTLAEIGSRAKAVECLSLKSSWEGRVPSASTMDGRMSRSSIFTAGRSSEMERPYGEPVRDSSQVSQLSQS